MRRYLMHTLLLALTALTLNATYIVVLRDGTRYRAKERWTVKNGKALVTLDTGSVLQLDPSIIDAAKSDELNRSGLGDVKILETGGNSASQQPAPVARPSLSAMSRQRRATAAATPDSSATPVRADKVSARPEPSSVSGGSSTEFSLKLQKAYENVGLFDAKVTRPQTSSIRVDVTADNEDQVFKTLSATAFVMARAQTPGAEVGVIELFMRTEKGGSSGRFKMTRPQAEEMADKKVTWQTYFVNNVLF